MGRINRVANQFALEFKETKRPTSSSLSTFRTSLVDSLLTIGIIFLLLVVGIRMWMLFTEKNAHIPLVPNPPPVAKLEIREKAKSPAYPDVFFEEANMPSVVPSIENQPGVPLELTKEDDNILLPTPQYKALSDRINGSKKNRSK